MINLLSRNDNYRCAQVCFWWFLAYSTCAFNRRFQGDAHDISITDVEVSAPTRARRPLPKNRQPNEKRSNWQQTSRSGVYGNCRIKQLEHPSV